jgi:probable F420-dependent oxidoreductase
MRISTTMPCTGSLPRDPGLGVMARIAEEAGADGLWVADHVLMVDAPTKDYPYAANGVPTWSPDVDYYESLTCVSFLAAATDRVRVGTAVLVITQRNVLQLAKTAASIDQLSGGRLVLGVGSGWYRDEIEALGYPARTRGRRFEEMLDVLHDCWSGRPAAYEGRELTVAENLVLRPRPRQEHGVPLLVGGMHQNSRRRAAEHGDGWLAIAFLDRLDLDELQAHVEDVKRRRADAGGRPFELVLLLHSRPEAVAEIPALLPRIADLGFGEVAIDAPWSLGLDAAADAIGLVRRATDEPLAAR